MIEGYPPPSPDMPSVWEPEAFEHEVRVLPPERSMTSSTRPFQGGMAPAADTSDCARSLVMMSTAARRGSGCSLVSGWSTLE